MEIIVDHLTKEYRTQTALQNVCCTFASGQIHGIVGRNGSGKSVLLRCICGYSRPTSGSVSVDGKLVGKDCAFPPHLGLLLDTPLFLPRFSGYENLMLLLNIRQYARAEKESMVHDALEQVGLLDQQRKKVAQYSLGMRQRLGLAQALMEHPQLLILDEPFNGLDRDGVAHVRQLLLSLKSQGVTMLLTSHYPEDLDALCDTFTHLDGGHVV